MTRTQTWLALVVAAAGLVVAAILGLWGYMSITATPLHPNPQEVASVTHSAPPAAWAGAVERGRQIVRTGLTEQNLPGLSVAVGVGGEIVWVEGFGWADLEARVPVTPSTRFRIGTVSTVLRRPRPDCCWRKVGWRSTRRFRPTSPSSPRNRGP